MGQHSRLRATVIVAPELWEAVGAKPRREKLEVSVPWHTLTIRARCTLAKLAGQLASFAGTCEVVEGWEGFYVVSGPSEDLERWHRSAVIHGIVLPGESIDTGAKLPRRGSGQSPKDAKRRDRTYDRMAIPSVAAQDGKPLPIAARI